MLLLSLFEKFVTVQTNIIGQSLHQHSSDQG